MRIGVYSLLIGLCSFHVLTADIDSTKVLKDDNTATPNVGVILPIRDAELNNKWKFAFKDIKPSGAWVLEWIPKNENIEDWSELIQIQHIPTDNFDQELTAKEFSEIFIKMLKEKFPEVSSTIIPKGNDSTLIEWSLSQARLDQQAQHELARIFVAPTGIYRLAYTKKVPNLDAKTKEEWLQKLSAATIKQK